MSFTTSRLRDLPDAIAPDGSEVRILCSTGRGSLAHFTLPPHAMARPEMIGSSQVERQVW